MRLAALDLSIQTRRGKMCGWRQGSHGTCAAKIIGQVVVDRRKEAQGRIRACPELADQSRVTTSASAKATSLVGDRGNAAKAARRTGEGT
jgi:hypothetical protein